MLHVQHSRLTRCYERKWRLAQNKQKNVYEYNPLLFISSSLNSSTDSISVSSMAPSDSVENLQESLPPKPPHCPKIQISEKEQPLMQDIFAGKPPPSGPAKDSKEINSLWETASMYVHVIFIAIQRARSSLHFDAFQLITRTGSDTIWVPFDAMLYALVPWTGRLLREKWERWNGSAGNLPWNEVFWYPFWLDIL